MDYKRYRDDVTIEGNAEVETIEAKKVPEGYVLEVSHMMIADVTTAGKTLEIGYKSMTDVYTRLGASSHASKYEYHLTGHAWIAAGETPYGRVTTSTDGDDIHFSVHGKLWKLE